MPQRTTVTWNIMITGFSRSGNVTKARSLFDQMPIRNIASWSAMIAAYINTGHQKKGHQLFRNMLTDENLKPDEFTLCNVLRLWTYADDWVCFGEVDSWVYHEEPVSTQHVMHETNVDLDNVCEFDKCVFFDRRMVRRNNELIQELVLGCNKIIG
ncbi:hypothetical protein QVD17_34678 [Tagetes erecta]|uniref:Pentatricopeptide repeat-containing protein n=1 Tax=Tagetes erecta TaxID=13708 RepID=A0AAD8JY46_TARER|nr:hypothetical protein QVD17_34678 [Tagetes erecta]